MKTFPYNPNDKNSIIEFARKLVGQSLRDACASEIESHGFTGKGSFGKVLEKYYFLYEPNSDAHADFKSVNLELKSTPLKLIKNNKVVSKERLVLNIISYINIIDEKFETSSFYKKNANLLIVFYLYKNDTNFLDYVVKLVDEWVFPEVDLEIIKRDWETIFYKVQDGKAHELSEGDTFYLGACTKGANALTMKVQPNNGIPAKQRAFSLKQGYVNHILACIADKNSLNNYGRLIESTNNIKQFSIEDIVEGKFKKYYGMTDSEIIRTLKIDKLNVLAKNFHSNLIKIVLGVSLDKEIEEFQKANIRVKVIRLNENNLPKENISFPAFKFEEIVKEDWDESDFKETLESKFLFVFFQFEGELLKLKKVKFWNMPHDDIESTKLVWLRTRDIITKGNVVKEVINGKRKTNFPGMSFNKVSHVRPHGINSYDTYPLPFQDKVTKAKEYTKQCFWLNNSYVRDEIFLKSKN